MIKKLYLYKDSKLKDVVSAEFVGSSQQQRELMNAAIEILKRGNRISKMDDYEIYLVIKEKNPS